MKELKSALSDLGNKLNSPLDQVTLIFCIFISFPLGLINYFITSPTIRLLFGLVTGITIQYFMYEEQVLHCLISVAIAYIHIKLLSRTAYSSPTLVLLIMIGHLSYNHIHQMLLTNGGWSLDVTLIHMQIVTKLSSLIYCYEDGSIPDESFKNEYQKNKKVVDQPTLLEIFSYSFYYSATVMGPYSEFSDFRRFITLEKEYTDIPMFKAMYNSLYELVCGVICMGIFLKYKSEYYPHFVVTPEFNEFSFFYKLFYLNMAMNVNAAKFYAGWKLITAVNVFNGLAYDCEEKTNIDGENVVEHNFNKIQAAQITKVLFNPNIKEKIEGWNHQTHIWLKYQVMLRFISNKLPFIRDNRILLTYMISAAWHGWYPVYYLVFFDFFLIDRICEALKKDKFFERLEHSSYILQIIVMVISLHCCNYLGVTFALLTFEKTYTYYRSLYFIPNLFVYITFIYVTFLKGETKAATRLEPGKKLDLSKLANEEKKIK